MKKTSLPDTLRRFFWDTEFDQLDMKKKPQYLAQRLLEAGDDKAVRWLRRNVGDIQIKRALRERRGFSPKIASYWSMFYRLPPNEVKCLQKPYLDQHKLHWPY